MATLNNVENNRVDPNESAFTGAVALLLDRVQIGAELGVSMVNLYTLYKL